MSSADYKKRIEGVELTPVSASVSDTDMAKDRWAEVLREVGPERRITWQIGDLLAFGERKWGDGTYQLAAKALGQSVEGLRNKASVSRRVPPDQRRASLPWRAHRIVAKMEPSEQEFWLDRAEEEGWTSDELRREITEDQLPTNQNDDFDPWAHWNAAGLSDHDPVEEPFKVVVSLETEADRDEFLKKNGSPTIHNRNGRTCSVWFPDRPKDDVKSLRFV